MLKNMLSATLRNMVRAPILTAMILAGLSLAFAAALFVAIFVYNKFHAEDYIPDAPRIYLVGTTIKFKGQPNVGMPFSAPEVAQVLRDDLTQIESVTRRVQEDDVSVRRGDINGIESVNWVDPNFFSVFRLPAYLGDPASALAVPDGAVITRAFAQKYFGRQNVEGQIIELKGAQTFRVLAVLDNLPIGTTLAGSIYISARAAASPLMKMEASRANQTLDLVMTDVNYTYVKLRDAAALPQVRQMISASPKLRSRYPEMVEVALSLVGMNDLHLHMPGRPDTSVILIGGLSLIGVLVTVVASINFVNLMTARANQRAKEVGVRKVEGATRYHLMAQFFCETLLFVGGALILAFVLVEVWAPHWQGLLSQSFSLLAHLPLVGAAVLCGLVFALLAGLYPALVLSAISPHSAFKGVVTRGGGAKLLREVLVGIQFALVIATYIGAVAMARQVEYATGDVLHFRADRTMFLESHCASAFAAEVRKLSGVEAQFCSSAAPRDQLSFDTVSRSDNGAASVAVSGLYVDFHFFDFYGIKPISGRLFSEQLGSDQVSNMSTSADPATTLVAAVLNESAARRLGFLEPGAAIGQVLRNVQPNVPTAQIIGVVPDFIIGPVYQKIRPLIYLIDNTKYNYLSVKFSGNDMTGAIARVEALWRQYHAGTQFRPLFLAQHFKTIYHDIMVEMEVFKALTVVVLITAASGLLGLLIFNVQLRLKEIGVRQALGAGRFDIAKMLFFQFSRPVVLSNFAGLPIAYCGTHYWLQGFVYHIDLTAGLFFWGSTVTMAVACGGVMLYSLYMAKGNPSNLLRYE